MVFILYQFDLCMNIPSRKLGLKGEGKDIRLACEKLWDDTPRLEEQDRSKGP